MDPIVRTAIPAGRREGGAEGVVEGRFVDGDAVVLADGVEVYEGAGYACHYLAFGAGYGVGAGIAGGEHALFQCGVGGLAGPGAEGVAPVVGVAEQVVAEIVGLAGEVELPGEGDGEEQSPCGSTSMPASMTGRYPASATKVSGISDGLGCAAADSRIPARAPASSAMTGASAAALAEGAKATATENSTDTAVASMP